jgi:large subunit ribosomal protein L3
MILQGIIGKKKYQASGFLEDGTRIPLTAIDTKGNVVSQVKTMEKEGYNSLQLGFETKKKPLKRELNHAKKAGIEHTPRFLREFRSDETADLEAGKEIIASEVLKPGDIVNVVGVSKGKGYAGVVKRHHFKGGPRTHGQSDRERAPGSIGQSTTPGRVYKGKRMAGRMGNERSTARNLEIIEITDDGMLLIKGLVPGGVNTILTINKIGENKKFIPLYKEIKEEPVEEKEVVEEEQVEEIKAEEVSEKPEEVKEELETKEEPEVVAEAVVEAEQAPIEEEKPKEVEEVKEENAS